jgi:hypothetical protein
VLAYEKHRVVLEDEPKKLAIQKLSTFRIKSEFARASILGYLQVLESEGEGLIARGEEKLDLGLDADDQDDPSCMPTDPSLEGMNASATALDTPAIASDASTYLPPLTTTDSGTTQEQQYETQNWDEWPLNPLLEPTNMPNMLELATRPWNHVQSAFDETGWGPELWQHFSAPSFNQF